MDASKPKSLTARFSVFEINFASCELYKRGIRLKIQKQPFEVLCMLLERPGEVVSREELRKRLWPENTFVEYEDSLNTAVRKLRAAISDSSDVPRFVETVARRGYRFIAPVQMAPLASNSGRVGTDEAKVISRSGHTETFSAVSPEDVAAGVVAIRAQPGQAWWTGPRLTDYRIWLPVSSAAVLVLIAGAFGYLRWSGSQRHAAEPSQRLLIAVLPFQNLTGDSAQEYLSDGLTEEMITQLGNIDPEHLGVVARTSVMHYKNSKTSLEQIGRELGVQYVIEGGLRSDGKNVRVTA